MIEDSAGSRYRRVIGSGCRTGQELERCWKEIREEATQVSQYLEEPEIPEAGVGLGREDGSTKGLIVR